MACRCWASRPSSRSCSGLRPAAAERATSRHERLAALPEAERGLLGGVAVTSMSRVVVDLARTDSMRSAVVTADAALRCGMPAERAWSVLPPGSPDGPAAPRSAGLSPSPTVSPRAHSSRISRFAMTECDLPAPELQVAIWAEGEFVARVDFLWRESRTVGEADGRSKYTTVDDLYAEKRREERLRDLGLRGRCAGTGTRAWLGGPEFATPILRAQDRGARGELSPVVRLVTDDRSASCVSSRTGQPERDSDAARASRSARQAAPVPDAEDRPGRGRRLVGVRSGLRRARRSSKAIGLTEIATTMTANSSRLLPITSTLPRK